MSSQNPKIKKVIEALAEGSESVRKDPSEENYLKQEGNIERAGNGNPGWMLAVILIIIPFVLAFIFSGGLTTLAHSNTNYVEIVKVEHNVNENDQTGMRIHLHINVAGKKDVLCTAIAYFHYETGEALKDLNGNYATADSQVATWQDFTPQDGNDSFNNFILFIPNDEFHTDTESYDLKFDVLLYDSSTQTMFAESDYFHFHIGE